MNQPSLLTVATDDTVKKPSNLNHWQAVRDDAAAGNGTYYGYNKNGVKETIGGPGAGFLGGVETGTFSRTAVEGSGTQVVATTKKVKMVWLIAQGNGSGSASSSGVGNIDNNSCLSTGAVGATNADPIHSINVATIGDGMVGSITTINSTNFEFTWAKSGAGQDVTVNWFAVTE